MNKITQVSLLFDVFKKESTELDCGVLFERDRRMED